MLDTGINLGFLMDTLVITLTAVCQKIEKIEAVRVNRTKKGFVKLSVDESSRQKSVDTTTIIESVKG